MCQWVGAAACMCCPPCGRVGVQAHFFILDLPWLLLLLRVQVFLAMQDRQLALRGKDNYIKDYYMPTPCDGLVLAGEGRGHFPLAVRVLLE